MRLPPGTLLLAGALWLSSGCATLNTSDMTPACRDQYNACLDGCRSSRGVPPPPPGPGGSSTVSLPGDDESPGCVDACNRQGRGCT